MDIQSITKSISTMEAQLGELRKIVTMMGGQAAPVVTEKVKKERKPRSADAKPNPWIDFTKLVRAALVPAAVEKLGAECQQFCKTLKSEQADYASWTPEAIQTRWRTWEKPAKAPTPPASDTEAPAAAAPSEKPKRVLTDEQKAKMKAGREAAKAKKAAEAASALALPLLLRLLLLLRRLPLTARRARAPRSAVAPRAPRTRCLPSLPPQRSTSR